jgi:NitT/TauT family transport system permease protein
MPVEAPADQLASEIAGLDALELGGSLRRSRLRRAWTAAWPKLAAVVIAIFLWQCVVWLAWKPEYLLPGPGKVWTELRAQLAKGSLISGMGLTLQRAFKGYVIAMVVGSALGVFVSRNRVLRSAVGSFITGLQTMPSAAWFPLALLLFKVSESAILFVVVLGAAPSIANGLIAGIDQIPPLYVRAGRVLGAKRVALYRHIILPAALPGFIAGMKQGWAFCWRSLMAGELIVIVRGHQTIGVLMQNARDTADAPLLMASMVVILVIGLAVDAVLFAGIERAILRRRGLLINR